MSWQLYQTSGIQEACSTGEERWNTKAASPCSVLNCFVWIRTNVKFDQWRIANTQLLTLDSTHPNPLGIIGSGNRLALAIIRARYYLTCLGGEIAVKKKAREWQERVRGPEMEKFQDSGNSQGIRGEGRKRERGRGRGRGSDHHRPFHQANGMGIPGSVGRSEGIYCGIQRAGRILSIYLPLQEIKKKIIIKLHMAEDFLLVLLLFIILSAYNRGPTVPF